jgi:hypothetical protein
MVYLNSNLLRGSAASGRGLVDYAPPLIAPVLAGVPPVLAQLLTVIAPFFAPALAIFAPFFAPFHSRSLSNGP